MHRHRRFLARQSEDLMTDVQKADVMPSWDESYDVVVMGSGLSGLSAALAAVRHGLKPIVLEKSAKIGGGTSYSTGQLWVPHNFLAERDGIADSRDESVAYMRFLGAGFEDTVHMLSFVDNADLALQYFAGIGIEFQLIHGLPDHYHGKAPGSKEEGRTCEATLTSALDLGEWRSKLEESPHLPAGITFKDVLAWGGRGNAANWPQNELADRREKGMCGFGVALVVQFLKELIRNAVPVDVASPVERLIVQDGRVVGVIARRDGQPIRLGARRGVVIACGGYESSPQLVREYEGLTEEMWTSQFSSALTGDGLTMGAEIGAKVYTLSVNMSTFLGFSTPELGDLPSFRPASVGMTSLPHTMVVNRAGQRFGDEAYFQALVGAVRQFDVWSHGYPNMPCFVIFDQTFAEKYTFNGEPPGTPIPDWVNRGDDIADLASSLGIDPKGLAKTIRRFNKHAAKGEDPDFHRGSSSWSRKFTGDLTNIQNPNLGPVAKAPFYGARLVLGGISSAGLMTNPNGQVLHVRGQAIDGLYASGNAAAFTDFGAGYQSGETLMRGMTASYMAIKHMAR
jgi:3-oxosteroid 1-dehydrogenase